jgi:hypothetical protein
MSDNALWRALYGVDVWELLAFPAGKLRETGGKSGTGEMVES